VLVPIDPVEPSTATPCIAQSTPKAR